MIGLTYEDILSKLKDHSGLGEDEITQKVQDKITTLSGLVSKEGALHIIANEMGLDLMGDIKKNGLKINRVAVGMRNVSVHGKVVNVYGVRDYEKDGKKGSVGSFLIGDETGMLRIVLWDTGLQQQMVQGRIAEGVIVKVGNGYIKENNGYKEMHLGSYSELIVNPPGVEVGEVKKSAEVREVKEIALGDLEDGVFGEVTGTIVQVFTPRFYDGCPECGKKAVEGCSVHGNVVSIPIPIMNFMLDDGTGVVRVVLFRDDVTDLLGKDGAELKSLVDQQKFDGLHAELLGLQVKLQGKAKLNQMGDYLEFSGRNVTKLDGKEVVEKALQE